MLSLQDVINYVQNIEITLPVFAGGSVVAIALMLFILWLSNKVWYYFCGVTVEKCELFDGNPSIIAEALGSPRYSLMLEFKNHRKTTVREVVLKIILDYQSEAILNKTLKIKLKSMQSQEYCLPLDVYGREYSHAAAEVLSFKTDKG